MRYHVAYVSNRAGSGTGHRSIFWKGPYDDRGLATLESNNLFRNGLATLTMVLQEKPEGEWEVLLITIKPESSKKAIRHYHDILKEARSRGASSTSVSWPWKKCRYLLNSSVITWPGTYVYDIVTVPEAVRWVNEGPWTSFIGYEQTCRALEQLLGLRQSIPVNRRTIRMRAGDEALVFRINLPAGSQRIEGAVKGNMDMGRILKEGKYELGILRCLESA